MSHVESLVSVVIPTHNRNHYLQQALKSVLGQSYSNFEAIVVDDGSADGTAAVVDKLSDPRVRYLYQANAGRSTARNQGMAAAKGIFLAFLDDDDLFLPHKLAHQVLFLEANPEIDLVGAGVQLIDEHGAVKGAYRPWEDQPRLTLLDCLCGCPLIPSTVLFRRRALDRLEQWFDPELDLAEDTDFFLRLLHTGCSMGWLTETVTAYRIHSTISQSDGDRYSRAYQKVLNKFFARPDLPAEVVVEKTSLFARYYLTAACHAYACGQITSAQQDLVKAVSLNPALQEGYPAPLAVDVAAFASGFRVANPRAFIGNVFDNLPTSLTHLRWCRHGALTSFFMGRVFKAYTAGKRPSLKDWLLGVCYSPRWLRNRGVWSILVREILGLPLPSR